MQEIPCLDAMTQLAWFYWRSKKSVKFTLSGELLCHLSSINVT